jgi:dTDP-4-dehydrorhamnose reductase
MTNDFMTIVVTGADGQLGQELVRLQRDNLRVIGLNHNWLDVTNAEQCAEVIGSIRPDAIIHAAAYTAVDRAESEPEAAYRVNADGTGHVAAAAETIGAKFCYVSTDYIFDGTGTRPYQEQDAANPQTVYGRTKLEGERAALARCSRTFVVRTSWVYGAHGANFVRTMLQLAGQHSVLRVVNDQVGSPTYTLDLAAFLVDLVATDRYGVYHASNSGSCSWYEFAQAIFDIAGMGNVKTIPVSTAEFPRPAPRPAYSVLGREALIRNGFKDFRHWREALEDFLKHSK